jgi:phosphoethanolamine N-methyltransferase
MQIYKKLLLFLGLGVKAHANQLDTEYSKEFTDLVEFLYGSDFLSQGGTKSVDRMFEGQILDGKKLLDIGSGLGGVDFYLAEKYKVDVIGIDPVERLVDDANNRKSDHKLIGTVTFVHHNADSFSYPYPDNSFDIVFSKEAFLHIADKASLLKEIFRVLRPGGQIIILDWLVESHELGPNITEMMVVDGLDLKMATPQEYTQYLHDAGFNQISSSPMNELYIGYTQDNIDKIKSNKSDLVHLFGEKEYEYSLKTWGIQKRIFELNEVLVTLLKATKAR